jgi:Ni/Co efflux regulator RcnB
MKKLVISSLIAASAIALSAGAASAQGYNHRGDGRWMSINERQHNLDMRIERGLQRGDLNRREAMRLRREFNDIARMEHRYRANGLSNWERQDLDRRFDRLAAQIRWERRDNQYGYGYGR